MFFTPGENSTTTTTTHHGDVTVTQQELVEADGSGTLYQSETVEADGGADGADTTGAHASDKDAAPESSEKD